MSIHSMVIKESSYKEYVCSPIKTTTNSQCDVHICKQNILRTFLWTILIIVSLQLRIFLIKPHV